MGYLVTPMLFSTLPDRVLAGAMAGRLFHLMGWVGMGCAAYLFLFVLTRLGLRCFVHAVFWVLLAMLIFVTVMHFGIQPLMNALKVEAGPGGVMEGALRSRFAAWHSVSSVLYLILSILGLWLVRGVHRLVR